MKKLFSAPTKKTAPVERCNGESRSDSKSVVMKKPDLLKLTEKKECNQQNKDVKSDTVGKGKPKQVAKRIPKSLTDKEYAEIFDKVINQAPDEDFISSESQANIQPDSPQLSTPALAPNSPNLSISVAKGCEDEFYVIADNLPIDQWNDRPEVTPTEDLLPVKKKEKEKGKNVTKHEKENTETATHSLKKKRKPKMKNFHKQDSSTAVDAKNSLVKQITEDDEDEEEAGTWVQCSIDDCSKWRYVPDISDPMNVPDHWDCSMNSDKDHNTCDASEIEYDESEHILTKFTLGSLVWAKMDGFPWWPAMIDTDPDYDTYFELPTANSMIPYLYHVTFMDEHVSRAWVRSHFIISYDHRSAPIGKITSKSRFCKKDLQTAVVIADRAVKLSLQDRLNKYSFLKRYSKSIGKRTIGTDTKRRTKKEKGTGAKYIMSSPDALMRELEIAIETCNNSNDSDSSEDDYEYLPQKSRRQDLTEDQKLASTQDCKQKKTDNGEHSGRSDYVSESEIGEDTQQRKQQFDPDIFTMELNPPEVSHQNTLNADVRKSFHDFIDKCNEDGKGESEVQKRDNQTTDTSRKMREKHNKFIENSCKLKNEKKIMINDKNSHTLAICNKKGKSDLVKKRNEKKDKRINKSALSNKSDLEEQQMRIDSDFGKENKDPNDSEQLGLVLSPNKKNKRAHSEKIDSRKKHKKGKKSEIDQGEKKKNEERKTPKVNASFDGVKKIEKKHFMCDIKKQSNAKSVSFSSTDCEVEENDMQTKTAKALYLNEKEIKNVKYNEIDNQSHDMKGVSHVESEKIGTLKSHNEKCVGKKGKAKSKGFIIPINNESVTVSKSSDRKVPTNPSDDEKNNSIKGRKQCDQFVPELSNEIIEEVFDFSCNEHEKNEIGEDKFGKNSPSMKICREEEDEELHLSMDSLENECLDIDVDTKVDENDGCISTKNDKHEYGKFGGHCSEHGSDSDPFELIED